MDVFIEGGLRTVRDRGSSALATRSRKRDDASFIGVASAWNFPFVNGGLHFISQVRCALEFRKRSSMSQPRCV